MRLYIIRHADPDYAHDTLTDAGHREAAALAERLAAEQISRLYCSPLGRARQTMQYTAARLGLDAEIQDWLQELPGIVTHHAAWGRLAAWDIPAETLYPHPQPLPADWPDVDAKVATVAENSDRFFQELGYVRCDGRYQCARPNRARIAVFCHQGLGLTWLAHLLHIPLLSLWTRFWLPPSSVTTILFEQRSPAWAVPRCLGLGDTAHLYQAGLPIQPSGIKGNFE